MEQRRLDAREPVFNGQLRNNDPQYSASVRFLQAAWWIFRLAMGFIVTVGIFLLLISIPTGQMIPGAPLATYFHRQRTQQTGGGDLPA